MTELNLSKGEELSLEKDGKQLNNIRFGIGWNPAEGGATYDLDSSVAVFNGTNKTDVVYFRNLEAKGIKHSGDDLTGGSSDTGPDEEITVNLNEINGDRASFVVTLYNAVAKGQNLNQVKDAFVEITDVDSGERLAKYVISDSDMQGAAMHFADVKKVDGKWTFSAIGKSLGNVDLNGAVAAVS